MCSDSLRLFFRQFVAVNSYVNSFLEQTLIHFASISFHLNVYT
jgi:hypothetical protein